MFPLSNMFIYYVSLWSIAIYLFIILLNFWSSEITFTMIEFAEKV